MSDFDWRQRAACGLDTAEAFFDPDRQSEAFALCAKCPVADLCHTDSKGRERYGVWGGRNKGDRDRQVSSAAIDTMRRLRAEGVSLRRIAARVGVGLGTVSHYVTAA